MDFTLNINNRELEASKGETILDVLNRNGVKVPTLCHIKDAFPTGACRMCVVEDEKTAKKKNEWIRLYSEFLIQNNNYSKSTTFLFHFLHSGSIFLTM